MAMQDMVTPCIAWRGDIIARAALSRMPANQIIASIESVIKKKTLIGVCDNRAPTAPVPSSVKTPKRNKRIAVDGSFRAGIDRAIKAAARANSPLLKKGNKRDIISSDR